MIRHICTFTFASFFSLAVAAEDNVVSVDIPVGVLIYDAVTEGDTGWAPDSVTLGRSPVAQTFQQSRASTRSSVVQSSSAQSLLSATHIVQSAPAIDPAGLASQIDLLPGETVLQTLVVPSSVVRIPLPEPVYTIRSGAAVSGKEDGIRRTPPDPVIDPFSGRLRDTVGWTGDTTGPASIGCFPAGACAALNRR